MGLTRRLLAGSALASLVRPGWAQTLGGNGGPDALPILDLDFSTTLDPRVTFTRAAGAATYFNSSGVLTSAGTNVARIDYNPTTLASNGLLIEEARTNGIRNSTNVGAIAGTPGTPPTNWTPAATGLTIQLVTVGTVNGMSYVDYRFSGTTGATFGQILLEGTQVIAALNAQSWTMSWYTALIAGSMANVTTASASLSQRDAAGASLGSVVPVTNYTPTATLTRISGTSTTNNASTAFVLPLIGFGWTSGVAVDFTLRIAGMQAELGAFPTSFIPTSTVAVTRAADVATMPVGAWFNAAKSTLVADYMIAQVPDTSAVQRDVACISDGTTANRLILRGLVASSSTTLIGASVASSTTLTGSAGTVTANAATKLGGAWDGTNEIASLNGGTVVSAAKGMPAGLTTLTFGNGFSGAGLYINGWIRRVRYWPRAMGANELTQVTAP